MKAALLRQCAKVVTTIAIATLVPTAPMVAEALAVSLDHSQVALQSSQPEPDVEENPFADLDQGPPPKAASQQAPPSVQPTLFSENFVFIKEIMSQFNVNDRGNTASRQSLGFETLKKFSTATATFATIDFQGRLLRRDGFNPVFNDLEGQMRPGWKFEYHNVYVDLYNILNPFLSDEQRGDAVGHFNLRAGRFYVPFGLNLMTNTHGTILQLSNEENFGFERDWYMGFWGAVNKDLNYDVYYLVGSGYDFKFKGQSGLGALRLSLANKYSYDYGLEGGFSILGGNRLSPNSINPIETKRVGLDGRYRQAVPTGLLTFTSELSGGRDDSNTVFTQLYQAEYLHASRKWGLNTQYRRFQQEGFGADAFIIGEVSWYFRNDVGDANLHWLKFNVQHQLEQMNGLEQNVFGPPATIFTLQYYFYQ